jgi:Purine catabolism regulatory protein-like family/PucR C-terminal helix-turn-helix domain/GGDEF-like domain
MLTVRDIASIPLPGLRVATGGDGLGNEITWLHVSELEDPTQFLEGGEFVLTTGLGVGELASSQRAYVRRLAEHGIVGLGFGVGFGFSDVPPALVEEANRLGLPVLSVPYEVPFVAITKSALSQLAGEQLERLTRALEVNERLAEAVLEGRGLTALLAIVCGHLGCSLAVVDETGRVVAERHSGRRLSFEGALDLPVSAAGGELARLKAAREGGPFGEYDRLVLHHGQTALAFELSRRRAVSAAELRLAGDLLEDLQGDRLDDREAGRRMTAFGLDPTKRYAVLLAAPATSDDSGASGEDLRRLVAEILERSAVPYLSTARRDRADFIAEAATEDDALALAATIADGTPGTRVGVGRPASGRALGRSLVEARAALSVGMRVASYRELGSVELLLSLPDAALEAYVDRVLGEAGRSPTLIDSLAALLDSGCRWSEAADQLGVHRHTLRYRMDRFREQTGRHPDDAAQRMELWLALKARQALAARA